MALCKWQDARSNSATPYQWAAAMCWHAYFNKEARKCAAKLPNQVVLQEERHGHWRLATCHRGTGNHIYDGYIQQPGQYDRRRYTSSNSSIVVIAIEFSMDSISSQKDHL
jgi:hypothetical protein